MGKRAHVHLHHLKVVKQQRSALTPPPHEMSKMWTRGLRLFLAPPPADESCKHLTDKFQL